MSEDLRYLDPSQLRFFRRGAILRLTVEGDYSCLRVSILRCFPLSNPSRYLSVRDGAGKEIGIIADPEKLDPDNRALVEEEIARRYLLPVILTIHAAKERFGSVDWKVATDRGDRSFSTANLRESVVTPARGRYILTDVDGNRYDVPCVGRLDPSSRSTLLRNL